MQTKSTAALSVLKGGKTLQSSHHVKSSYHSNVSDKLYEEGLQRIKRAKEEANSSVDKRYTFHP